MSGQLVEQDCLAYEAGRQAGTGEGYAEAAGVVRALWQIFKPNDLSGGSAEDLLQNLPAWLAEREHDLRHRIDAAIKRQKYSSLIAGTTLYRYVVDVEDMKTELDRIFGADRSKEGQG